MSQSDRAEDEAQCRRVWKSLGNLTNVEIEELLTLEFTGVSTVPQQIRRYYLKLKCEKPAEAARMWNAIPRSYRRRVTSKRAVKRLCAILYRFWRGFVISFNGRTYSVRREQFYRIS